MILDEECRNEPRILYIGAGKIGIETDIERAMNANEIPDDLETIDCVVCEHSPPRYDALSLLDAVRADDSSLPVLVLTTDERVIRDAIEAGATDCAHPDCPELLTYRIDALVDRRQNRHESLQTETPPGEPSDAIIEISTNGIIEHASDGVERIFGYDPDTLRGRSLAELIPARSQSGPSDSFIQSIETDGKQVDLDRVETFARHRAGHEMPVEISSRSKSRRDGCNSTIIIRDISKRKAMKSKLEASRERYRKLIETTPEAILVADAETGSIIDANPAAESLLDRPKDEICGMHQTEIHPVERRAYYRDMFEQHAKHGGITKNATGLEIARPDGSEIPVEVSSNVTKIDGRRIIHATFKDVSDRTEREQTLDTLRSATRDLMAAETKAEICEIAVAAADETLGFPLTAVYLSDEKTRTLRPVATTESTSEILDRMPTFEAESSLTWSVFESGEFAVFEGVNNELGACDSETTIEKELVFPLDDHGVFLLGSQRAAELDEFVLDFAEILAANVQSALDRAEREEALSTHRKELEELNRINAVIRDVDRTLVQATTREEIERAVCNRLATVEPYEFTWVGEYDASAEAVSLVAHADKGIDNAYFEPETEPSEPVQEPAMKALETHDVVLAENVTASASFDPWRDEATDRELRSLAAIPIRYDETCYGVLVIHANRTEAFDDRERAVLAELGETVGLALAGVESRNALVSDSVVEVEIESRDSDDFFVQVPKEVDCEFILHGITVSTDGSPLAFVTATDVSAETVLEQANRFDAILDAQLIHEGDDGCLFRFTHVGLTTLITTLADRGATIDRAEADEEGANATVELPTGTRIRQVIEEFRKALPDARLVAQREQDRVEPTPTEFRPTLDESLTDRQWSALETAYLAGYFEWPRISTGEEVASSLDVTPPTFHQHLRRAQAKMVETFFDR
ncbi:bacterio-opsin activator domain-containing protein [Haladaptatus caseinilyticus]|uniref:bacterio-opsin activator domain-containing protein n=1 Tax=Haladaptatus caseinilyticus TaxID=2993314 RepID=UPI00224B481F|nr:bacterio-opsin activator domain-containing protein [Haladaptatus caseinilyticus]